MKHIFITVLCAFLIYLNANAQTLGLLQHQPGSQTGYTMFSKGGTAYLIDTGGRVVHQWNHGSNSMHPGYLNEDGSWMSVSRGVEMYDWDGQLLWEYNNPAAHHDAAILPNGNVLVLINGFRTNAEAIAAGRDPSTLTGDVETIVIHEIDSNGNVVWEWDVWDHLIQEFDETKDNYGVVADNPQLVDLNFHRNTGEDWLHANAIDYNPELDQILISPRFFSEIWIIDHSTTTAEAAGHTAGLAGKGGDLLYRWGNPLAYQAGTQNDQLAFGSHDAQWIKPGLPGAGNILIFNNGGVGYGRDGDYSSVDELSPPLNGYNYDFNNGRYGPETLVWQYTAPVVTDFYSSYISGAHRLPNGNTFIDEGSYGRLFEVNASGEMVWEYQNSVTNDGILMQGDAAPVEREAALFRSYRYPSDYLAFNQRDLIAGDAVEQYAAWVNVSVDSAYPTAITYPNPDVHNLGVGQQIPLIAFNNGPYEFLQWVLMSGDAQIADPNSPHTTALIGSVDSTIVATFNYHDDWIFRDGFE